MIAIVDYGMGNLASVEKALQYVGCRACLTRRPDEVKSADAVVLPGVGAFGQAMNNLSASGMDDAVCLAIEQGKPFLGICLGLQLLFETSEESFGAKPAAGLGLVAGTVKRFPRHLKVPQIGWNQVHQQRLHPLLTGLAAEAYVYFVHSYYVVPDDEDVILTSTEYGLPFTSGIARDNIMAIQFHPEKSSTVGLQILENFGAIADARHPADA